MHSSVYTRLDTTYTINSLAQFLSTPGRWHQQGIKHTLRYIKDIVNLGIKYQHQANGNIFYGFSDADQAADQDTRRSTSGYYFLLVGGVITWSSKDQASVALSNTNWNIWLYPKPQLKPFGFVSYFWKLDFTNHTN